MDKVIVIKVGSGSLVGADARLDIAFLGRLAQQIAQLVQQGWKPVLVSSGAIACGMGLLGHEGPSPTVISERQALAAIGQADLIYKWQQAFAQHGCVGAQVLLTADDFNDRGRYLNLTANFRALFEHGVIPIVNENDVVSTRELALGDNDRLSALVASQLGAERLLLLTDVDALYDADPRAHPEAQRVGYLPEVTEATLASAGGSGRFGTGGMRSKLVAAQIAAQSGVITHIALAHAEEVVTTLIASSGHVAAALGTTVAAGLDSQVVSSRRHWLALARDCRGKVLVDAGAHQALTERGTSLLLVGIQAVEGTFERGDTIALCTTDGEEFGRGLTGMAADEMQQVAGKRVAEAIAELGYSIPKSAVHRDNILLHTRLS